MSIFFEPLLIAVERGIWGTGAVGDQGKQGAFDSESEISCVSVLPHNGANAELIPAGFEYVDFAIGLGAPVASGTCDLLW